MACEEGEKEKVAGRFLAPSQAQRGQARGKSRTRKGWWLKKSRGIQQAFGTKD